MEKLTNEGMSFSIDTLVYIAEKKLPEQFGGTSSDYQVQDASTDNSLSALNIAVSPGVTAIGEDEMIIVITRELGKVIEGKRLMPNPVSRGCDKSDTDGHCSDQTGETIAVLF